MKPLLFLLVCFLFNKQSNLNNQDTCKIFFGNYISDNGQNWKLDPPQNRIFIFHRVSELGTEEQYSFDYNDCDTTKETVTLCSTERDNYILIFTKCDKIECADDYKFSKLSFKEGRSVRFTCRIDCEQ